MECPACGRHNWPGTQHCVQCGATLGASAAKPSRATPRQTLTVTLVLAACLVLVGVSGIGAQNLLRHAMRPRTAGDAAALLCTALRNRDYDTLISQIDPAPVPPAASGAFDGRALQAQLQALDTAQGPVTSCGYQLISASGTTDQFAYTIHRARTTVAIGMLVEVKRQPDGNWKITRRSTFIVKGP